MYHAMNKTELKAEALYQLAAAQKSGVKNVVWANNNEKMIVFYNNGVIGTKMFNEIWVQFELNSKFYVVPV